MGQFTVGYRESEVLVICTNSSPALRVPFPVYECTGSGTATVRTMNEMTKLALDFSEGHRKAITGFRNSGFARIPAAVERASARMWEDEAAINR